jgi:hypothetical protein
MAGSDYESYDPISPVFNYLKIRYADYDNDLSQLNTLNPEDKVNLFISMESIYKNISMIQDLEKKLLLYKNFKVSFIANVLNLVAHYKRFFKNNTLKPRVFIYQTDLGSDEFPEYKYNDEFRSYYLNKYNENPKYTYLTDSLKEEIIPELITYCQFIPDVYFITSKNIEGSLVPYIIGNSDSSYKNFIISTDMFESQYSGIPGYCTHLINRFSRDDNYRFYMIKDIIQKLTVKSPEDSEIITDTISPYHIYCGFLATIGEKQRSIDGIAGIGIKGYTKLIRNGYSTNEIPHDVTNPEMIGKAFHNVDSMNTFVNNYYCTCVEYMYNSLTKAHIDRILNQITDRSDINSLEMINSTKFMSHPIMLEGLL